MSRLDRLPAPLRSALAERRALKVIAGLTNFDAPSVERISRAAGRGGADLVDVAADAQLVRLASARSGLPICFPPSLRPAPPCWRLATTTRSIPWAVCSTPPRCWRSPVGPVRC